MRFESLLWTLLAVFLVGGAALETETVVVGVNGGGREYQAEDGEAKVPPPIMDPGSTDTAPVRFTR